MRESRPRRNCTGVRIPISPRGSPETGAAGLLWEAMLTPNGRGVSLGLLARLVLCRLQAEPVRDAAEASALPRPSAP